MIRNINLVYIAYHGWSNEPELGVDSVDEVFKKIIRLRGRIPPEYRKQFNIEDHSISRTELEALEKFQAVNEARLFRAREKVQELIKMAEQVEKRIRVLKGSAWVGKKTVPARKGKG